MGDSSYDVKGIFNDLTRTLFASAIYLDDLRLIIQEDQEAFNSWSMANDQLNRAIEYFFLLKSSYIFSHEIFNNGNYKGNLDEKYPKQYFREIIHRINEDLTVILNSDILLSTHLKKNKNAQKNLNLITHAARSVNSFIKKLGQIIQVK